MRAASTGPPNSEISAPAAKIRSPPVSTTAPGGSARSPSATVRSSASRAEDSAFTFGWFSVITATPSSRRSSSTSCWDAAGSPGACSSAMGPNLPVAAPADRARRPMPDDVSSSAAPGPYGLVSSGVEQDSARHRRNDRPKERPHAEGIQGVHHQGQRPRPGRGGRHRRRLHPRRELAGERRPHADHLGDLRQARLQPADLQARQGRDLLRQLPDRPRSTSSSWPRSCS